MPEQTFQDFGNAYQAGRDCALHGATKANAHYVWFSTPEMTAEWQRGKEDAEHETGKS